MQQNVDHSGLDSATESTSATDSISDTQKLLEKVAALTAQIETNQRDREIQRVLYRIADITTAAEDMDSFYASLHEIVTELTSTDAFFIAIYHEKEQAISFPYYVDQYDDTQKQGEPLQNNGMIPIEQMTDSLTWQVVNQNEVLRIVDIANTGVTSFGKKSQDWLGIPLRQNGCPIGVFCIQSYQPNFRYTDTEVELMIFISQHIATALHRRRVANELKSTAEELAQANDQLMREIEERERINRRMVQLSHEAGKAEIATGVLHNVGNVLNSINVSASLVDEIHCQSRIPSLQKAVDLLNDQEDLAEFFGNDQRGSAFPTYLTRLVDRMEIDRQSANKELKNLIEHLNHVKVIVAMQQSYAGISGLKERVSLPRLFEEAEILLSTSFSRHQIEVVHDFDEIPDMMLKKQKILQVLVNLLKNAKDSMTEGRQIGRKLEIRARLLFESRILIEIQDNGLGIEQDNLTNIFSHGFTTKEDGHGFGLHSCANTIGEMGGEMRVASTGVGQGATFSIEIPFIPAVEK